MRFPYTAEPPFPFTLATLANWVEANKPTTIEMTDRQYALFANLCRANRKEFNKIPIVFLDAPVAI